MRRLRPLLFEDKGDKVMTNKLDQDSETKDAVIELLDNHGAVQTNGYPKYGLADDLVALMKQRENLARIDELESNQSLIGYGVGGISLTKDDVHDRIATLKEEQIQ